MCVCVRLRAYASAQAGACHLLQNNPFSVCRFGVTLLAVLVGDGSTSRRLQLNPGSDYILKKEDFCFYMSLTREEYTEISPQVLAHKPSHTKLAENLGSSGCSCLLCFILVQLRVVSRCLRKPMCASPCLSEVSPMLPFEQPPLFFKVVWLQCRSVQCGYLCSGETSFVCCLVSQKSPTLKLSHIVLSI